MKWFWLGVGAVIGSSFTTLSVFVFLVWVFKDAEA